jgi:protein-arginine kinase activator protein McsA
LSFIIDNIGSQKPTQESKKSSKEIPMCSSCASKDETPLSSDRNKWPIGKIEISCFQQICKLLDLAEKSKEPLVSALGCFDQITAARIVKTYGEKGGLGTAKELLGRWGSRNHENNVGALKKILKDTMQRSDVVIEIEKWENLSVCHGCGIKLNKLQLSQ